MKNYARATPGKSSIGSELVKFNQGVFRVFNTLWLCCLYCFDKFMLPYSFIVVMKNFNMCYSSIMSNSYSYILWVKWLFTQQKVIRDNFWSTFYSQIWASLLISWIIPTPPPPPSPPHSLRKDSFLGSYNGYIPT